MHKTIPVDRWRTVYWMRRLLERTGLGVDALAARLLDLLGVEEGVLSLKSQSRAYLKGKRTASIAVQGRHGTSWVVLADQLAPGSFWDFCDPLFDLLEEWHYWHQPQRAHERFLRRIQAESLVADHARARLRVAGFDGAGFDTSYQSTYNRLRRIRRALLAVEGLCVDQLFAPLRLDEGHFRRVNNPEIECRHVNFPPTLRDFTVCFALYLESIELADPWRLFTFEPLLEATKCALNSEPALQPVVQDVLALIDNGEPTLKDLLQSEGDLRVARTAAPRVGSERSWPREDSDKYLLLLVDVFDRIARAQGMFPADLDDVA